MDVVERWSVDPWKESFSAPLSSSPNVVLRVPAKPKMSLQLAHALTTISKPSSPNPRNKGHRCGVIPYASVVWWIAVTPRIRCARCLPVIRLCCHVICLRVAFCHVFICIASSCFSKLTSGLFPRCPFHDPTHSHAPAAPPRYYFISGIKMFSEWDETWRVVLL